MRITGWDSRASQNLASGVPSGTGGGGSMGQVTDGTTTVDPVTGIAFTSGAAVTDLGGGVAGVAVAGGSLEVKEADGTPDVTGVTQIIVPNGSLTDNTGGSVTLAFGGGGDASGLVGAGWDGGLSVLVAPHSQDVPVPFTGTVTGWRALAQQSGSAQWDVQYWSGSGSPSFASICGGAYPSLSSTDHNSSTSLGAWTAAVSAGGVLRLVLTSVSSIYQATLTLDYSRP